eukprot:s4925_g9.t1
MAAYGPPIAGPVTFEMATPETTSCPQVVTTFPWPGEVNVKPGLDYIVLHFDRCVRLHEKETATLLGSGARGFGGRRLLETSLVRVGARKELQIKQPPVGSEKLHQVSSFQV